MRTAKIKTDAASGRGMLIALVVLVLVVASAVWYANQSPSDRSDTTVNLEETSDPGTATTIAR